MVKLQYLFFWLLIDFAFAVVHCKRGWTTTKGMNLHKFTITIYNEHNNNNNNGFRQPKTIEENKLEYNWIKTYNIKPFKD